MRHDGYDKKNQLMNVIKKTNRCFSTPPFMEQYPIYSITHIKYDIIHTVSLNALSTILLIEDINHPWV